MATLYPPHLLNLQDKHGNVFFFDKTTTSTVSLVADDAPAHEDTSGHHSSLERRSSLKRVPSFFKRTSVSALAPDTSVGVGGLRQRNDSPAQLLRSATVAPSALRHAASVPAARHLPISQQMGKEEIAAASTAAAPPQLDLAFDSGDNAELTLGFSGGRKAAAALKQALAAQMAAERQGHGAAAAPPHLTILIPPHDTGLAKGQPALSRQQSLEAQDEAVREGDQGEMAEIAAMKGGIGDHEHEEVDDTMLAAFVKTVESAEQQELYSVRASASGGVEDESLRMNTLTSFESIREEQDGEEGGTSPRGGLPALRSPRFVRHSGVMLQGCSSALQQPVYTPYGTKSIKRAQMARSDSLRQSIELERKPSSAQPLMRPAQRPSEPEVHSEQGLPPLPAGSRRPSKATTASQVRDRPTLSSLRRPSSGFTLSNVCPPHVGRHVT